MISVKNGFLNIINDQEAMALRNKRSSLRSFNDSFASSLETFMEIKEKHSNRLQSDDSTVVPSLVGRRLSDQLEDRLFENLPKNLEHLLSTRFTTFNGSLDIHAEANSHHSHIEEKENVTEDGMSSCHKSCHERLSSTPSLGEGGACDENFVSEESLFGDFVHEDALRFTTLDPNLGCGNWCDEESEGEAIYPSRGSKLHNTGDCRPCAFLHKPRGCTEGYDCEFCHSCDKNDYVSRKKLRAKKGKEIKRQAKMTQGEFGDEEYF